MIRLPALYEEAIIEYARKLDSGETIESESKTTQRQEQVEAFLMSIPPRDRTAARGLMRKFLKWLE
ncbi:MAG: hypothetical protein HC832_00540 [Leptolyngbyaceae cyanobacterium RM1_405_57]|nr:hypothetical protein [Leptolyngbyaceae cyanobacterium RM1_405_57]